MRRLATFVILLVAAVLPARADFASSQRWYEGLPGDLKYEVQADLILLGFYTGMADRVFGQGTYGAITSFQTSVRTSPSGVLSARALDQLRRAANEVSLQWGIEAVEDEPTQAFLLLPTALLTVSKASEFGTTFSSADYQIVLETMSVPSSQQSYQSLFNEFSATLDGRSVAYKSINDSRWVVAGRDHASIFYTYMIADDARTLGFTLTWSEERTRDGGIVATYLASHFIPSRWLSDSVAGEEPKVASLPSPADSPRTAPTPSPGPSTDAPAQDGDWIGSFFLPKALPNVVLLSGEISMSTALEFIRALRARPAAEILALNSIGGLVDPALIIAHEVKERGLATLVVESSGCYSACAFIYFAGRQRMADGSLGVHQLWNESNDLVAGQVKLSDVVEALDDFEVNREVLSIMLRTPPADMHVFSEAEIARLGLNLGDPYEMMEQPEPAQPNQVTGWGGNSTTDTPSKAPTKSGMQTISLSTIEATSIAGLLSSQSIPRNDAFAVAFAFQSAFGFMALPASVSVTIWLEPEPSGRSVLQRVEVVGMKLPETNSKSAVVVRTPDGGFSAQQ